MSAPVSVNSFSANPTPGNNFYQFSYNVAAGSDRLLVIQLTMANTVGYSGCTYDGVAMTQLHSIIRSGLSQRMAFFYLLNPNTGNNTLRIKKVRKGPTNSIFGLFQKDFSKLVFSTFLFLVQKGET